MSYAAILLSFPDWGKNAYIFLLYQRIDSLRRLLPWRLLAEYEPKIVSYDHASQGFPTVLAISQCHPSLHHYLRLAGRKASLVLHKMLVMQTRLIEALLRTRRMCQAAPTGKLISHASA